MSGAAGLRPALDVRLTRLGVVMTARRDDPAEAEGVLNPGSGRGPDGRLWLFPRLVAAGNVSRIGRAEVVLSDGVPTGVRRDGIALAADAGWERAATHGGVEDPRITHLPSLGLHVMTYVAYGPLGPRSALATSPDLRTWTRRGPISFAYQSDLDTDLNIFPNKDCVFFPEVVSAPGGRPAYAMLHRPMWDLSWICAGESTYTPAGIVDDRPGIWISYVDAEAVQNDPGALGRLDRHRLVALPEHEFEAIKIGAGPPPLRVEGGWLLLHHGAAGRLVKGLDQQPHVHYAAGAMLLDGTDPARVLARTPAPLLEPQTALETHGTVPNVVFPTAIEAIEGEHYVFYGMADSAIGVARLDVGGVGGAS